MKVEKYSDFLNEKFYKKIYSPHKRKNNGINNRVQNCVESILSFLAENDIYNWDKFMKMSPFDRDIVDKLIDTSLRNMDELKEVRFRIRLELSDRNQLIEYKQELEEIEDYEKCALVLKKLSQK